jgi:hypothetical protein
VRKGIGLIAIVFSLMAWNAFGQITFQKTYGGVAADAGYSVQQTADGGYIIVGTTNRNAADSLDVYLIKTDAGGDTLWTKTFGGIRNDYGNSVQQTTDGGYIIAGTTYSFGAGSFDVYLIKTDANGDSLWTETFGGTGDDDGNSVQQTTDGGYIITGESNSFGAGFGNVYLIKTNTLGVPLWTKTYGGSGGDDGYFIQQTTDGGYIICGLTASFGAGGSDFYLIKTDATGDTIWTKTFGGTNWDYGYSVQQTADGGYIMVGSTFSFGAGDQDVYLIKTDSTGAYLWSRALGFGATTDIGESVQQTTDGGYIIAGYTNYSGYDVFLIKIDSTGDPLWTKTFGGTSTDRGYSVQQTTDGGYIIAGNTFSFGAGGVDVYLIKTNSLGNSGCNETNTFPPFVLPTTQVSSPSPMITSPATVVTTSATIVGSGGVVSTLCTTVGIDEISYSKSTVIIYPNPSSGIFYLGNIAKEEIEKTEVYNYTGEKVFEQKGNLRELNLSGAAAGIYFYTVSMKDGKRAGGKMVKE